nr:MAG TPA: hypothetical protein [Caudoviricetes sp.]
MNLSFFLSLSIVSITGLLGEIKNVFTFYRILYIRRIIFIIYFLRRHYSTI